MKFRSLSGGVGAAPLSSPLPCPTGKNDLLWLTCENAECLQPMLVDPVEYTKALWDRRLVFCQSCAHLRQKLAACRVCAHGVGVQLHHLVPVSRRAEGDDVADNLVPLCLLCHALVEARDETTAMKLGLRLTPAEISYVIRKKGSHYLADRYRLAFTEPEIEGMAAA